MPSAYHEAAQVARSIDPGRSRPVLFWPTFAGAVAAVLSFGLWATYSPGQDHLASISLNGDGAWYRNYEPGFESQDPEIFFDGIGRSIENARRADIIFLGTSKLIFGTDWRLFEKFEREHHLRMFNMALAGVAGGEFSLRIINKWGLRPKLWVINTDRYTEDPSTGFFHMDLSSAQGFGSSATARVVNYTNAHAIRNVVGRNVRWRLKMAIGLLKYAPYRSAKTGNWYLDDWPNFGLSSNPPIAPRFVGVCAAATVEVDEARRFLSALGGGAVLIQVPSAFACAQRVHEIAAALNVRALTAPAAQFTSGDGGGHLDGVSARKYTAQLFAWLEQLPEFRRLFPESAMPSDELARVVQVPQPPRQIISRDR
jgi:hypothetical protein